MLSTVSTGMASPEKSPSELEALQKSYDEYVESSKDFEGELEHALKEAEDKLAEAMVRKTHDDAKVAAAQAKSLQLSKELQIVQNDLTKAREKIATVVESTVRLESSNESLSDRVRILEATEADLTHKLENAEEDIVFLQSDLAEAKQLRAENELRLREELSTLQAEVASISFGKSNGDYKSHTTTPNVSPHSKQAVRNAKAAAIAKVVPPASPVKEVALMKEQEMESEIQDLSDKMLRSSDQIKDLKEEVRRLTEEAQHASHHADQVTIHKKREIRLEALVKSLNAQLFEAKGFLIELEESHDVLEETNTELYLANTDLEALNVDLEDVNEAMKDESIALREENSILDDKFILSKQYNVESDEKYHEIQEELDIKTRQLTIAWDNMKEQLSEINDKNLQIIELKSEKEIKLLELECLIIQLVAIQNPKSSLSYENIEISDNSVNTIKIIERLKFTISDLKSRSENLTSTIGIGNENENEKLHAKSAVDVDVEEKKKLVTNKTILEEHSQLIVMLKGSVNSLEKVLTGYECDFHNILKQIQNDKLVLNQPEIEKNEIDDHILRFDDIYMSPETKINSPTRESKESKEGRKRENSIILTPIKSSKFHRKERILDGTNNNNDSNNGNKTDSKSTNNNYNEIDSDSVMSEAEWTLEPLEDWEIERSDLLKKCQAYREELEEVKALQLAATSTLTSTSTQQRQSLLHGHSSPLPVPMSLPLPLSLSSNHKSKIRGSPVCTVHGSHGILNSTATEKAIVSDDIEKLKAELKIIMNRHDNVRSTNAVLMKKLQAKVGNIQVCCRTRPPTDLELAVTHSDTTHAQGHGQGSKGCVGKVCVDVSDDDQLSCYDKRNEIWRSFAFDRVWPLDATQEDVFSDIEPLLLSVTEGYNTCLLAYGQTGSGKTFTMNGYGTDYGVSYRTMQKIFEVLEMKKTQAYKTASNIQTASSRRTSTYSGDDCTTSDTITMSTDRSDDDDEVPVYAYTVTVSMMQIYNEQVYDLLGNQSAVIGAGVSSLDIRQAPDGTVSVPGLEKVEVKALKDVMEVFSKGSGNRATTSTNCNETSSRSHLIMLIDIDIIQGNNTPIHSKLFLVDLAGSERTSRSGVIGQAMKEAQYINKSLSALGDVMEALDQKAKFIPYRNSKLTYLLQDALGGNSRTMMVVTVCPTDITTDETLFTLQFATRVRNIVLGSAKKNAANGKNLEDAMKNLKNLLKESKKKNQLLEDTNIELKKDIKKSSEKNANVLDVKVKAAEEKKAKIETMYAQLQKSHQDLYHKYNEERENKLKAVDQLKDVCKEAAKERAEKLKEKNEKEKEKEKEREKDKEKEKGRFTIYEDVTANRQSKISTSTSSSGLERDRSERFKDQNRPPNINFNLNTKDQTILPLSDKNLDMNSENGNNLTGYAAHSSPSSDREQELSERNSLCRSLVSGSTFSAASSGSVSTFGTSRMSSSSCKYTKSTTSVHPLAVHCNDTSKHSSNLPPRLSFGYTTQSQSSRVKEEYLGSEIPHNTQPQHAHIHIHEVDSSSSNDVLQLGPPVKPSVHSNIAARSKDALLRHQLRMDKRRADRLVKQLASG